MDKERTEAAEEEGAAEKRETEEADRAAEVAAVAATMQARGIELSALTVGCAACRTAAAEARWSRIMLEIERGICAGARARRVLSELRDALHAVC